MTGVGIIMSIILGAIAGWIAEQIMKSNHGLITNIVLGIVGALLGNFLLGVLVDGTFEGWLGQLVVAVAGACILIWGYRAIRS